MHIKLRIPTIGGKISIYVTDILRLTNLWQTKETRTNAVIYRYGKTAEDYEFHGINDMSGEIGMEEERLNDKECLALYIDLYSLKESKDIDDLWLSDDSGTERRPTVEAAQKELDSL